MAVCPKVLAVVMLACASGCAADDLRPSTFTAGWSRPEPTPETTADAEPPEALQAREPWEPSFSVFRDWRDHHNSSEPCPANMVLVDEEFCIDRWEASLEEVTPYGVRDFPPTQRVEGALVRAVSRPGVIPQAYIAGHEAQRACEMAGKRLCYDSEWWRACAGRKKTIYPYGTVHREGACNEDRKLHPMLELYGENAGPEIWYVAPMNNPAINQQPGTIARTGSRRGCVTDQGLFDMVGNVHEWTNDPAGTFLGGTYSTKNALGCQYKTTAHGFDYHDYSTGFRCCAEPLAPPGGTP